MKTYQEIYKENYKANEKLAIEEYHNSNFSVLHIMHKLAAIQYTRQALDKFCNYLVDGPCIMTEFQHKEMLENLDMINKQLE